MLIVVFDVDFDLGYLRLMSAIYQTNRENGDLTSAGRRILVEASSIDRAEAHKMPALVDDIDLSCHCDELSIVSARGTMGTIGRFSCLLYCRYRGL